MPVFDPDRSCLIVRLVYDGPAFGGKTTNLQRVCELFPIERRSEMFTPAALKGRTMFFDWLEVEAGRVAGHPLRVQLLTVPGQGERSYRRRPLLESADGVVFVFDGSNQTAATTSKKSYAQLRAALRRRLPTRVPITVQANKQDVSGALKPDAITRLLRLDDSVNVVPAAAASSDGVRDTLVIGLRSVLREVQALITAQGLESLIGAAETADQLFDNLLALEDDPEHAARLDEEDDEPPPSLDLDLSEELPLVTPTSSRRAPAAVEPESPAQFASRDEAPRTPTRVEPSPRKGRSRR